MIVINSQLRRINKVCSLTTPEEACEASGVISLMIIFGIFNPHWCFSLIPVITSAFVFAKQLILQKLAKTRNLFFSRIIQLQTHFPSSLLIGITWNLYPIWRELNEESNSAIIIQFQTTQQKIRIKIAEPVPTTISWNSTMIPTIPNIHFSYSSIHEQLINTHRVHYHRSVCA
jgi:hypothetical protein